MREAATDEGSPREPSPFWEEVQALNARFDAPGRFVTLVGYEDSLGFPYGHHNVFFRGARGPLRHSRMMTLEELWAVTDPEKAVTIGAVCKALKQEFPDISISKIRYLEDQKLLTPRRTPGGYRLYSAGDIQRLRAILRLQRDEFLPLRVIREELTSPGAKRRAIVELCASLAAQGEKVLVFGHDVGALRDLQAGIGEAGREAVLYDAAPSIEARDRLAAGGLATGYLRVKAVPFGPELREFVAGHERVYVVENNANGQLAELLRLDLPDLAARLHSIAHLDGLPLTARFVAGAVSDREAQRQGVAG